MITLNNQLHKILNRMENKGFIYLTKEFNSDNTELKHKGYTKIGIGRTNDPNRRALEHSNGSSKSTISVKFIECFEVHDMYYVEKELHKQIKNLGYYVVERNFSSTEVFSGIDTLNEELTIIKIFNILKFIISEEEFSKIFNYLKIKTLKILMSNDNISNIINIYNPDYNKKDLNLLPHQEETVMWIIDKFSEGYSEILLNHKPRSGKSFIMYNYILKILYNSNKKLNIVLLTQYPILNKQWAKEFNSLKGSSHWKISKGSEGHIDLDPTKHNLVMISLQDAKGIDNTSLNDSEIEGCLNKQKFLDVINITWDLIIFDEIHKGKETPKTDKLLSKLKYGKLIGLSATPSKNLMRGTFSLNNTHTYGIIEENHYRNKYFEEYKHIPKINFYLYDIHDSVLNMMKNDFSEEDNFTFTKFFRLNNRKNGLHYKNQIIQFFKWVFSTDEFSDGNTHEIINKSSNILLFVPNNECQKYILEIITNIVENSYDIIEFTNSDINDSNKLYDKIHDKWNVNRSIIIANRQLTTGVTLKKCDTVMFLNDWKNYDEYIQASYRCQTPSENKFECNVIDFNPSRFFDMIYNHVKNTDCIDSNEDISEKLKEFFKCAPIFKNQSLLPIKFEEFNSEITKSLDYFNVSNNFNNLYNKNNLLDFKKLLDFINNSKNSNTIINFKLNENAPNSGKNEKYIESEKEILENNIRNSNEYEKLIKILTQKLDFIQNKIYIFSILNWFKCSNLDKIFEMINEEEILKEIIYDIFIKSKEINNSNFSKEDVLFQALKDIINNCFNKSKIEDLFFRLNNKILLDVYNNKNISNYVQNIEKVYELINKYLGISTSEKKLMGEVFTPFELIEEMLDQLPKEVWSNSSLKWLDPAVGIGNFPASIIRRLMISLESEFPNENDRYKHIIENQIYMCDIQSKNIFILKNILDPDNKFNLNIHFGNFLDNTFNDKLKKWNIQKYDIVVGNPPYTDKIDLDFLMKSYTISSKILFVHPSSWLIDEKNIQKKFIKIKNILNDHLEKIILFNGNHIFNISLFVPCVITYINKDKISKKIFCIDKTNKIEIQYNNIYEINKFSDSDVYIDLKNKILEKSKIDNLVNYKSIRRGNYYVNLSLMRGNVNKDSISKMIQNDFYTMITKDSTVSTQENKSMFFSFEHEKEANNFLNYLKTNFARFCLSIYKNNQHLNRGELSSITWLDFSREWTDENLKNEFDLSDDEVNFINFHIPKYY